jgi:hypothetical protein
MGFSDYVRPVVLMYVTTGRTVLILLPGPSMKFVMLLV